MGLMVKRQVLTQHEILITKMHHSSNATCTDVIASKRRSQDSIRPRNATIGGPGQYRVHFFGDAPVSLYYVAPALLLALPLTLLPTSLSLSR